MINSEADNIIAKERKDEMQKSKRKEYQKWYYETYTKRRRQNGAGSYGADWYKKKTPEEKAENRRKGIEKRQETMKERYTKEEISEIYRGSGHRLANYMKDHPDKRYRPSSEKAKEMQILGAEARRANREKRKREEDEQNELL